MSNFKVGDRVRYIYDLESVDGYTLSRIYSVVEITPNFNWVKVYNDAGKLISSPQWLFEPFDENAIVCPVVSKPRQLKDLEQLEQLVCDVDDMVTRLRILIRELKYQVGKR